MRDVIQKVLASEAEAKRLILAARAEAEHIFSQARTQSREVLEKARHTARADAEQIIAAATASAQHDKSERLSRAAAEIRSTILFHEKARQSAVAAGLRAVCGHEMGGGP